MPFLSVNTTSSIILPSAPLWALLLPFTASVSQYMHKLVSPIDSYVFVMLSPWQLTFSSGCPKCQLIIFTPCTTTPLFTSRLFSLVKERFSFCCISFCSSRKLVTHGDKSTNEWPHLLCRHFGNCISHFLIILFFHFSGCGYNKPASVKGKVVNMTVWSEGYHNGLTADLLIVFITW